MALARYRVPTVSASYPTLRVRAGNTMAVALETRHPMWRVAWRNRIFLVVGRAYDDAITATGLRVENL